ncbi:phosphoribosyl-AMP cyclohydrolase [Thioclava sp. FTW29]|uniref:phosphoribosyl-AMP cyclohydrolase n=1 Tax=Thioclava litoralis TaxID=3076557 RepID=A0ABZ1E7I0_9RHOB|nr:phosphoribosyl-AMP cyclohydrolase [Thioclava sp. FTW29]
MTQPDFHTRRSVAQVEEGTQLAPKFDRDGLLPCITTDAQSGELLMLGWMDADALRRTLCTGEAHYFSRARGCLWHKGASSGLVQQVVEARIDDDQDALWLRVRVAGSGASCHVGYRSCFYRAVPLRAEAGAPLVFTESRKTFEPQEVYGDAPTPTRL